MAKHKLITMLQRRLRNTWKFCYGAIAKRLRKRLRPVFLAFRRAFGRRGNPARGFVLPTAVMLLLVVSLVIGAMLIRTFNRTEQVVNERQEKVIYNAATPAIDRAKAKIEYLFSQDPRLPSGVPSEDVLWSMMLNDGSANTAPLADNPYDLPGETRLDLNGQAANAWSFESDSDGDGENDTTIAYSIIWRLPAGASEQDRIEQILDQTEDAVRNRAENLAIRNGPFSSVAQAGCDVLGNVVPIEKGFFKDTNSSAILRKNFQIDAFAISNTDDRGTVTTLELQQDRQADRGNKWGAWFRYDLEVAPGQPFLWNGAMHSDGSLLVGQSQFRGYLISSPDSCLYKAGPDTSEITISESDTFEGQMMSANLNPDAEVGADNFFHLWDQERPIVELPGGNRVQVIPDDVRFSADTDSVQGGMTPSDITLDPITLFTTDESAYKANLTPAQVRDPQWNSGENPFTRDETARIYNQSSARPFIDDFYRADDRYGPKPLYGGDDALSLAELGVQNGDPITGQDKLTTLNPQGDNVSSDPRDLGLDGYWERRAWREGMRVIVGQRLELGNDPLPTPVDYVGESLNTDLLAVNVNNASREHETLQRRALRDNLAAVQTTAVYHHASGPTDASDIPVAAFISTVHPGTAETLKRSSIFKKPIQFRTRMAGSGSFPGFRGIFGDDDDEIAIDFFTGRGTNGWEIEFTQNDLTSANMETALRNLANFAGEEDGAFPPLQETSVDIHPHPELTKWGNFSNLNRALNNGNGSIADESYKHTAALTLGMLAYNLTYLDAYNYTDTTNQSDHLVKIDEILQGGPGTPPAPLEHPYATNNTGAPIQGTVEEGLPLGSTPEEYVAVIENIDPDLGDIARLIHLKEQTNRDRTFGFRASPITDNRFRYEVQFLEDQTATGGMDDSFTYGGIKYDRSKTDMKPTSTASVPIETTHAYFTCDFSEPTGNGYFGINNGMPPSNIDEEKQFIRLATALCGVNEESLLPADGLLTNGNEDLNGNKILDSVKYPSLFYLFPKQPHNRTASGLAADFRQPTGPANALDPPDRYLTETTSLPNPTFEALEPNAIALQPKAIQNWDLPYQLEGASPPAACNNNATAAEPNTNCGKLSLIYDGKTDEYYRLAFKDSAFFNGREMMNVRALNMDLELLTNAANATPFGDLWIAAGNDTDAVQMDGGIVYAFREDAIREDAIARPAGGACNSFADVVSGGCESDATAPFDPQVAANGISPKPVDYYPDPDRRPYGFRLMNGEDISRDAADGATQFGITFVSDNPAYLQGDFNCHGPCGAPIEEFNQQLPDTFTPLEFYGRDNLNDNFARNDSDSWRFSEFLVDAMTLLSDNFCEGSIEDGFLIANSTLADPTLPTKLGGSLSDIYGCANASEVYTSYTNQNRPQQTPAQVLTKAEWLRENPADPGSPIKVSANGNPEIFDPTATTPLLTAADYSGNYWKFTDSFPGAGGDAQKPMNTATPQQVNAVIISGIVPSRGGQTYGGLHNFPRFIEDWVTGNQAAKIRGSLIQLNFSTYATAPFDQDAWEPRDPAILGGPVIHYYQAPQRLWGYDVALQYVQPGPITTRLVTLSGLRSEFYSELALDDPYILNLRCAAGANGVIDDRAECE